MTMEAARAEHDARPVDTARAAFLSCSKRFLFE
jgi:hypothetical protein